MRSLFEAKGTRLQVDFALAYAALSHASQDGNVDEKSFDKAKVRLEKTTEGARRIWAQEYCQLAIAEEFIDPKRFEPSQALKSITAEVLALPFGVTDAELQRTAHGVVVEQQLLERVKKIRQKWAPPAEGYSSAELTSFQDVMRSVFHPDGEHHGMDIETAYEALCSFADLGEQMAPDTFIERTQVVEVAGLPLEEKAAIV